MESGTTPLPAISILIVEDDKDTREILVATIPMKFPDVTVYSAVNGRTGLELFKTHTPDIVITDINMPEMNGVQMVNIIRTIKPDAMLIVLTADTGKATLEDSVGKGFEVDHYIMKPVDYRELFAALDHCIADISLE